MLTYRIYQIKNKTSLQGKNICNGFIYNDHMFDRKGNKVLNYGGEAKRTFTCLVR